MLIIAAATAVLTVATAYRAPSDATTSEIAPFSARACAVAPGAPAPERLPDHDPWNFSPDLHTQPSYPDPLPPKNQRESVTRLTAAALPGSHSHNDYEQKDPLATALLNGFVSVEVDVWLVDDDLRVGHTEREIVHDRTLRNLYLAPLAARTAALGSIYPDHDRPFQLLVDIKNDEAESAYPTLYRELNDYSNILTRYIDGAVLPGAVSLVITGKFPRSTLSRHGSRYVAFDGRLDDNYSNVASTVMPLCSGNWEKHFTWRGQGRMPAVERRRLRQLVDQAHAGGRKVRFWGTPNSPAGARRAVWRELALAKVDYIGVDHPDDFRRWRTSLGSSD